MRPSDVLLQHRETIRSLFLEAGIFNPRVFGSVVRGDDRDDSDLDLVVDSQSKDFLIDLGRLEQLISQRTGLSVNVFAPSELPPKFRERVLSEAAPL
jgi:predicted nucleotidyltransferase